MTRREIEEILTEYEEDEEISLEELEREIYEARKARIEELEERQHESGFYAFQDLMWTWRNER